MARLSLLPKHRDFFNLFDEAGTNTLHGGELNHYFVEIKRLENEGDRITREALASLFKNGIDPMIVIRWKDIFDRLEDAIDACEKVANILEGIVVKHA